ncbi:hypothetical protein GCM10007049_07150 [Echinicola pacifica]|uniref:Tetratricopeptide repeat protein n=1 Tax=Echinicola pacifica TaxID=346377 RepID=A0A918PQ61_9BACT|nr:tetratricopeptide repeat protein [Echinicola pacifica]GGZ17281.1 hypothetical protein GCM10007049_07150 [Echinicola pacifica]
MLKKVIIGLCLGAALFSGCSEPGEGKGQKYFKQGNYTEAVEYLTDKLSTDPKNVEALYTRGRAYEELGDLESASADFEAGYKIDEKNTRIMLALSNVYQKQKKFDRSLLYAEYATNVAGAPAMAYFMKARALHQIGNTEEAMKEYSAAIEKDKKFGQAFYYRGILKYATKKKRGACDDFKQASKLGYAQADEAMEEYCK